MAENVQRDPELVRLSAAWDRAILAWDRARCADWHPGKADEVARLHEECRAARMAHNRAWILIHAPRYAAEHNITKDG